MCDFNHGTGVIDHGIALHLRITTTTKTTPKTISIVVFTSTLDTPIKTTYDFAQYNY